MLAVVNFNHHFRHYLLGQPFTLRTDHGSLVWIQNFKEPEGQLARWLERLQEYNFSVVHRPGVQHGNADSLSRIPCSQCGRKSYSTDEFPLEEDQAVCQVSELPFQSYTLEQIRQLQLSDPSLGPILRAVEINHKPHQDQLKSWSQESRRLMQFWETLLVKDGTLWRLPTGDGQQFQLVVPFILRDHILDDLHAGMVGGHMGEEKLVHRLLERFYWPGCAERAKEWCRTCPECVTRTTGGPKRTAELNLRPYTLGIPCRL